MNWMAATCWALLLAATLLGDGGEAKGGRGGARGSARGGRGGARGVPRVRVRPAPRYSGSALRVGAVAAAAAAGAAAAASSGSGWRRALGPWESDPEGEDAASGGNRTAVYSYWAWTSAAGPTACSLHLCLLLGGALSALGLLQP
ncbi:unnamed protein product [Pipistrellus nathusii]|uniref:Shadow of prion protein n=1 Tax=Pipistrellus nathusii TaxID=59473 RepID=A0ABN9ZHC5_PIPNA